jgi:hypothetical protein
VVVGEKLVMNGLQDIASNPIVPLGFKTLTAGQFSLTSDGIESFDTDVSILLEDVMLDTIQDLRINPIYTFTSGVTDTTNRFKIHFGNMVTSIKSISESSVSIYSVNNNIYVNTPKTATIEIYDMIGNLIMNQKSIQGLNKLQLDVEAGIYIVKVQTITQLTTQKVMINK